MTFEEAVQQYDGSEIDFKNSLTRMCNNGQLYSKFLHKFLTDGTYRDFCEAYEQKDMDRMLHTAHTLKGLSGNLGLSRVYEHSARIVEQIRNGETDIDSRPLDEAYGDIIEIIKNLE